MNDNTILRNFAYRISVGLQCRYTLVFYLLLLGSLNAYSQCSVAISSYDNSYCEDSNYTFYATTGYSTYAWYKDGVLQSGTYSEITLRFIGSGAHQIQVVTTGTGGGGGGQQQRALARVAARPPNTCTASYNINVSGNQILSITATSTNLTRPEAVTLNLASSVQMDQNQRGFLRWTSDDLKYSGTGDNLVAANVTRTTQFTLSYTGDGCYRTGSVVINFNPTCAIFGPTSDICAGSTVNYSTDVLNSNYQWKLGGSPVGTNSSRVSVTFNSAGTYNLTLSSSGNYNVSCSAIVQVVAIPSAPTEATNTICGSGSVTPRLPYNANSIRWYASDSDASFITTSTSSPSVSTNTTFYTQGFNTETGCKSSSSKVPITISVEPLPVDGEIFTSKSAVCLGEAVTISSRGGVGTPNYWASTNGGQSWNVFAQAYAGQASFQFTPTEAGTYRFHLRNQTSCGFCWDVGSCPTYPYVDVVVNPIPAVPELSDNTVCGSGTIVASLPANATTLNWYTAPSGGQAVASTTSPLATSTTTFYVSGYNTTTTCESTRTPVTLTVNPLPEDGQIAADVTSICLGSTITISSSGGVGTPNYWASTNEGQSWNVFGQAYAGETSFQFTPTEAGTYRFHLRNQTSCGFCWDVGNCTTYPYVDVVVNPIPAVPELSDNTVCGSGTIVASLPANATTLNWYTAPSGGQAVASTTSPLATSTTTFYVSGYNTDAGCESARTPVTLTVNPLPAAPVVSSSVVCGQGSLVASDAADASTNWYDAPTDGTLLGTGAVSPQATQTSTFYASYSAAGCESARTGGTVTVIPLPTINATNNGQLTYGSLVTLSTASAGTYRWQLNGQDVSTAASVVADKIGTYTLSARQDAGSPECASLPVQVKSFLAAQPAPVNYTSTTRILKKGVSETASLYSLAQTDVNQSVTYQDGLGRTFQQVAVGLSPQQTDLVTPVGYGKQGLVDSTFLPYATASRQGLYRPNAIRVNNAYTGSEQQQFYQNTAKVAADAKPYARAVHRAALDARVTEQGAPGAAWQPGSGHTATSIQVLNTASYPVRFWKFDGTTTENYPINTVLVTIAADENGNQVRTYTNKQGQTVLKQVQLDETISGAMVTWLETYYIYDQYGRLAYQLPPRAVKALGAAVTLNANNVPELIYKYTYDTRGRLTQQKVPGAAVKFFVYDKLNRLVLSQDGNQRAQNAWAFIKYDVYQRPVYSGIYTNTVQTTLATVQTLLNNIANTVANSYETPLANAAATLGYSNLAFPTTGITILSASYYDGYDFDQNGTADYTYDKTHLTGLPATAAQGYAVRNLPTGSKKLVMGTTTWLTSAVFYDDYDRPVQTLSGNHLNPTGMDKASMVYDFVGRVLNTKTTHTGVGTVTVAQRYTYDQAGRTKGIYHTINTSAEQQVAAYEYNALGQLVDKKLHVSGTTALQSVDMRYTIRGWLKSINNATLSSDAQTNDETNDYFGMELLYENLDKGLKNIPQFNGNVTAAKWKSPGLGSGLADQRSYTYGYDKADKLKAASFKAFMDTTWTKEVGTLDEAMTYDHNGNLLTLIRKQNQRGLNGIKVTSTAQLVDNLTYTYTSNTNRMLKVEDAVATTIGSNDFKNGSTAATEYTYNTDGSLTGDLNKGIDSIKYNLLGKPSRVKFKDGRVVTYKYDAAGTKLGMATLVSGVTTTTDYVGGFVYTNNALQFFSSPEGRVIKKGAAYEYQYAIADHQGNTRVVFSSAPATPVAVKATFEGNAQDQATAFSNVSNVVTMVAANQTAGGNKVVRMNQGYSVGPSKSMKVFTGDKIDVEVYAYYEQSSGWGTTNAPLTTLVTAIAGAFGGVSGAVGESGSIFSGVNTALGGFGLGPNAGDGAPSAFLNYILFDKNYKVMNMGWKVVPTTAKFAKQRVTLPTINVKEAGYLFTYLSYEDQSNNYVYFDDYKVTYTPTNVVQYNEYYPYGLQTATSWTRENATGINFLGNGGTELNTTTSLYDLEYRNYDPALARMHQVDPMADKYASYTPYNYSFNAPSNFNDVNGADPSPGEKDFVKRQPMGEFFTGNDFSRLFRGGSQTAMFDRGWSPTRNSMTQVGGMTGEQYSQMHEDARTMDVNDYAMKWSYLTTKYNYGSFMFKSAGGYFGGNFETTNGRVSALAFSGISQVGSGGWVATSDPSVLNLDVQLNQTQGSGPAWDLNGDGILTKNEADNWYRTGNGLGITVDASRIDLRNVNPDQFKNGKFQSVQLFFKGPWNVGVVYGRLNMTLGGNNKVTIEDNPYDFSNEGHSWKTEFARNLATSIGGFFVGEGLPYNIHFVGSAKLTYNDHYGGLMTSSYIQSGGIH